MKKGNNVFQEYGDRYLYNIGLRSMSPKATVVKETNNVSYRNTKSLYIKTYKNYDFRRKGPIG